MDLLEDYIGAQCEIKTMQNDLLAVGGLKEVNGEKLYITMSNGEVMPTLPYHLKVKIVTFTVQGSIFTTGNVYISNNDFLCISDVEMLSDYEKRNSFRVNVSMHTAIDFNDKETGAFTTSPVDVRDLSLGGVSFVCPVEFQYGDSLELLLCLLEARRVYFKCVIRRIMEDEKEKGKKVYGCSFEEMTDQMNTALCAYLFQQQRLQIHKSKNSVSWVVK